MTIAQQLEQKGMEKGRMEGKIEAARTMPQNDLDLDLDRDTVMK